MATKKKQLEPAPLTNPVSADEALDKSIARHKLIRDVDLELTPEKLIAEEKERAIRENLSGDETIRRIRARMNLLRQRSKKQSERT